MKKRNFIFCLLTIIFLSDTLLNAQIKITSNLFGAITARQIGPAVMSGRVTAIDAVNNDSRILYVGAAGGGVWKSITGGTLFKPVFDKYCQSIGAITINQKKPDVVWVGTGECNMRNSISIGDGIYKSEDAGETWKKMGLENTQQISKIIIDPNNDNIIYVSAPGPLWCDSENRGLYKTYDGGLTWEKILYIDEKTGCADIIIDPKNPDIIYAAMWQFRRQPWSFSSGGPGSGLYKSEDAGKSWRRVDKGFTDGELGRICLAISPTDTKLIYAIAESKNTGLFLSKDGGETWTKNSSTGNVTARPFYFSVIQVDPSDSKRIYRPAYSLSISDDGGQTFREASFEGGWVHSDHHAIWIDPVNPQHIYLGTDGGVYVSYDRGNNWIFLNNLPVSQYYHVTLDMENPYNVYGGLQDNGSWVGPSSSPGGVQGKDWKAVGFGDGFWVWPDLADKNYIYWESQGGNINKFNRVTSDNKDIRPFQKKGEDKLRFNWNTPIYNSPNNPNIFYIGAQFLYRTSNKGDAWIRISPDLTTNDPEKQKQEESGGLSIDNSSAENHCTIFTINESPIEENIIWVGTDDGNLQVTEDGGQTWKNVIKNVTGLPKCTWVSSIESSRFKRNTVYVTFDGHASGDMKTYIYKTTDLGKTWKNIATSEIKGYAHKIKEDLINPKLLFAGTVFGLFISIDGGINWAQYSGNVPPVEVRDITINQKTNDLVLATHGRGILIIDDITPLRKLNNEILNSEAYILPTRINYLTANNFGGNFPLQAGEYRGQNATTDAVIIYYLKERAITGNLKIEIYDKDGKLLKSIDGTKRKGINKVEWDMRLNPPRVATGSRIDWGGFIGPVAEPGVYTIKLLKGDKTFTGTMEIRDEPNFPYSKEDKELQKKTFMQLFNLHEDLAYLVAAINKAKEDIKQVTLIDNADATLKDNAQKLIDKLETLRKTLVATKEGRGITGEEKLREKITDLYGSVSTYGVRPTDSQLERVEGLLYEFNNAKKSAMNIYNGDLKKLNEALGKAGINKITILTREDWEKQ